MEGFLRTAPFTILFLPLFGMIVIALVGPRVHRIGVGGYWKPFYSRSVCCNGHARVDCLAAAARCASADREVSACLGRASAVLGSHSAADYFV